MRCFTLLVPVLLLASAAQAEVSVSGDARMGLVIGGNNTALGFTHKAQFSSRARVTVTMSGETDGGVSFGANLRMDEAVAADSGGAGAVFIAGTYGKLAMGDVDGAAEVAVGDLPEVGFTGLDSLGFNNPLDDGFRDGSNEIAYLSDSIGAVTPSNPRALYTYDTGPFTVALSLGDGVDGLTGAAVDNVMAAGVRYDNGAFRVGLGYERARPAGGGATANHLIVGGAIALGTTEVQAFYGDGSGTFDGFTQYGVGFTAKRNALTLKGYAKRVEGGGIRIKSWGVGAAYDLGGGASIEGGVADTDFVGFPGGVETATRPVADLGVKFTF